MERHGATPERAHRLESAYPDATAYPLLQYQRVGDMEITDIVNRGLTKRELFAAMIAQGLSAGMAWSSNGSDLVNEDALAIDAVTIADALLKELAK